MFLAVASVPAFGQHNGFSYELQNEIGTFNVISLTVTHKTDNTEGVTYVLEKQSGDTVYRIGEYLQGWVGLSRDGKTLAHLISEEKGDALDAATLTFYRSGQVYDTAPLSQLISYDLREARLKNQLSKKGWLKNDSVLHKMASSAFFVSDDKLYISFIKPKLSVFDMNQMFHIYTGNGANHFTQNYYSIPNAPFRTNYDSEVYIPTKFPSTIEGRSIKSIVAASLNKKTAIPEESTYRVEISVKLKKSGNFELRTAAVFSITDNEKQVELSEQLVKAIEPIQFSTELLPPNHPAWLFETSFWLK